MPTTHKLTELLDLRSPPIAVTFQTAPPANIPRVAAPGPSGCTYWKHAAEGRTFYTEAADHYNCPIGAYTHAVDLPPERAKELEGVVGTMIQLGYIRQEEVAGIPRRESKFAVAVYAPLAEAPIQPDVVLVRGNARQLMLLAEAAGAAGIGVEAMMGRPTCAAIPAVMRTQHSVTSLGCIGNRIYTELPDDEFYFALPGRHVQAVVDKLAMIMNANRALADYHRERLQAVPV